MTHHRRIGTIGALGLAVALLAGCAGSSGDGADGSPVSTTTRSGASSTSTAPARGCDLGAIAGRHEVSAQAGGGDRSYVLYVPAGAPQGAPLVLDLTAYSPASMEEGFSGWTTPRADGTAKADEVGAVVVTPEPVNGEGLLTWNIDHTDGWTDDQAFLGDLLDEVEGTTCADSDRVLVTGFAIGGVMASALACEQPERITAIATVSGLWDPPDCDPSEPTPVLSFHGDDDHFLPYDGGIGDHVDRLNLSAATSTGLAAMADRPGALASAQAWADRNGCQATPGTINEGGPAARTWADCDDGADVELVTIPGGSHTWPGSTGMADYEDLLGPVSIDVDATDLIWDFFEEHGGR